MTTYLLTSLVLLYNKASGVVVCSYPWLSCGRISLLYRYQLENMQSGSCRGTEKEDLDSDNCVPYVTP